MRVKIIACEAVAQGIKNLIPDDISCQVLRFGLHNTPEQLHEELQSAIDNAEDGIDTLLLGYGACSKGTAGLTSDRLRLVIPKVDDCIALFMGSQDSYRERFLAKPGTFYLTKGWIECGDDPYTEYLKLCKRFSREKAYQLERMVIHHYAHLALINTGEKNIKKYREYAQQVASFFGLQFEEIVGSTRIIEKLLQGKWDKEEFAIVEPGEVSGSLLLTG